MMNITGFQLVEINHNNHYDMNFKNNLDDPNILSPEILEAMDNILLVCPHVVFGGSIALNAVGLLNRKIGDIDIFVSKNQTVSDIGIMEIVSSEHSNNQFSESTTDVNGEHINRVGMIWKNIKICCFSVPEEQLQYSIFKFKNRIIKIQNVNHAILAKRTYADRTNKHKSDLNEIVSRIDGLDNLSF